jgi:hypothetical protein
MSPEIKFRLPVNVVLKAVQSENAIVKKTTLSNLSTSKNQISITAG